MRASEPAPDEDPVVPGGDEEEPPWPVGFIVLASLAGLYVAWRVIQLVGRGLEGLF